MENSREPDTRTFRPLWCAPARTSVARRADVGATAAGER